jgi:hypothetical protein
MVDQCPICRRPNGQDSQFCSLHSQASKNLEMQYERWRKAFGEEMDRTEYFRELLRLEETGRAVMEVIGYLQRSKAGAT